MVFQLVFLFVFVFSGPFVKVGGGGGLISNCKHKDLKFITVSQSREIPVLENLKKSPEVFSQGSMHEQELLTNGSALPLLI